MAVMMFGGHRRVLGLDALVRVRAVRGMSPRPRLIVMIGCDVINDRDRRRGASLGLTL
jgi:hypothetical protein